MDESPPIGKGDEEADDNLDIKGEGEVELNLLCASLT